MRLMIKLLGITRHYRILDIVDNSQSHKVIVPHHVVRDHEKAHETL